MNLQLNSIKGLGTHENFDVLTHITMSKKEHRGRIQAQGEGLEASESWAQDEPLTAKKGLGLLRRLKKKISEADAAKREKQFHKAEGYINRASQVGGLDPHKKTFKKKDSDARVDIEILSGKAFVSFLVILILLFGIFKLKG